MNIYLIFQQEDTGYDTFDAAIVCAASEEIARHMSPRDGKRMTKDEWKGSDIGWASSPNNVQVTLIGTALPDTQEGLVLASFNAG